MREREKGKGEREKGKGTARCRLAPKAVRWCGFGFAAGCEAEALPRRRDALYIFGLCP